MHYLAFLLAASVVFGGPKMAEELDSVKSGSVDVIIRYKQPPSEAQRAKTATKGGNFKQDFTLLRSSVYTVPASAIADLAADADVEFISPDRTAHAHVTMALRRTMVGSPLALTLPCAASA
jgi:hypothetical protein